MPDASQKRPNVLFIMTDQQRWDALGCHSGKVFTPNLDRLAAEAADFRQFFTQSPVCVPSRCNLFAGRYPHSHRVRENNARLDPHEVHLFKALKQVGYRLGYVEKNHLLENGEFANFDFTDLPQDEEPTGERAEFLKFKKQQGSKLRTVASWASAAFHDFSPEVTTPYRSRESAIEFLRSNPADQPFCLCVSFADPHAPHVAPRKFESMYPLDEIEVPEAPEGVLEQKAPRFRIKQEAQGSLLASEEDKQRYLAVYRSMISWVDENVGAILDALDEQGLRDETIIVFTSDHGDFNFDYGMCKKDLVLLDCLLRVPCLIAWRGHVKPREVSALAEQIDVLPTLLELCGAEVPFGCQGRSLAALLAGRTDAHRDEVHAEICPPWLANPYKTFEEFRREWEAHHEEPEHVLGWTAPFNVPGDFTKMLRTEDFKYILYGDGFEELYDLRADPGETENLARRPEHAETTARMRLELLQWNARSEDPLDPMWHRKHLAEYDGWQPAAPPRKK